MKNLVYGELLSVYGKMLTKKQFDAMEQYYHLDYSLAEIAQNQNITRQAVRASLVKAQRILDTLEENIGFLVYMNKNGALRIEN